MYITVFTPVYNRGYCVRDVYTSLVKQTYKNFEWLVIDDGSSDDTENVINACIKENIIKIRYIYQENGGQHRALNHAIEEAEGNLLMIVDSDDTLEPIALERIAYYENTIQDKVLFAGVSGLRQHHNGKIIGTPWPNDKKDFIDITNTDRLKKKMLLGDKAEAYYTQVLREFFPIPGFEGENDVEKGVLWNRIASRGLKIRWFNEAIYNCEYLADGMSRNIIKNYLKNYNGYLLYINELIHCDIGLGNKIKFFIKAAEIAIEKNDTVSHFSRAVNMNLGLTALIMGIAHITPIRFKMKCFFGGGGTSKQDK
jgi:Glycosyltransferases involved in cell wall biogenesis